ncbi:hypothetical protein FPCIR_8780 [Fusarium pseudocircinatum]|uniref:NACHT domain-containing protein n=1 Tax=Fusarium pseudocircinatum TaxID=56676 RepID=A0A8H5L3J0_9HYPO|nr:hypothetical protein FPCIR_8780 [Fusarium pseudocircinatum]
MLTGFEALSAASAVLQVISFATDVVVACKNAYDGATTSQDDLQRYTGQMSEAVGRVHTRCEQMRNTNTRFASPDLQNIAKECKDAADKLKAEVQYVTSLQAQGDILKSIRKTFRASRHRKKLQALQESLSKYQEVMEIELTSHLCSQSHAINLKQDASFGKLDTDVQFLISQVAQGITEVKDLVRYEHVATRNAITQEGARAEIAINSHTDGQLLELRTDVETNRRCETFLQSLKAPRMNQRYNDVMDSEDASFSQVFATYEDMKAMYHQSPEAGGVSQESDKSDGDVDPKDDESFEVTDDLDYIGCTEDIHRSWASINSWLQSKDKLFYIQGKPGSGKSTLVKFILSQYQTQKLVRLWSPDAIVVHYFFWKIGSEEQNSIKGLWCSLLYQRLQDEQQLLLSAMEHFSNLSLHSEYHDWSIKDLQDVWEYLTAIDSRSLCIFIDGLDEIRNEDGFSQLSKSIQSISRLPKVKLCMSTRPEAQIMRWLQTTNAAGILLEDLTRFDMLIFVRKRLRDLMLNGYVSSEFCDDFRDQLVDKAQGVFLWLHLATRSIIEGVENQDSENMLSIRLHELPGDLERLYTDMWQRSNAKSTVYRQTARRLFRYVLGDSTKTQSIAIGVHWCKFSLPLTFQIACAEDFKTQQHLLMGTGTIGVTQIQQMCDKTKASIHTRCAGLLEVRTNTIDKDTSETLRDNKTVASKATSTVAFIHRTAHDFLTDTEAGIRILGREPLSDFPLQTRLLKGLVCTIIILTSKMNIPCPVSPILEQIATFATRWGSEGLHLVNEMLDANAIQPLFDKHLIRNNTLPWRPEPSFFTYLIRHDVFEDYVISQLTAESSPHMATSVMREGWRPRHHIKLRKRTFDSLIALGGDPHEYGVLLSCLDHEPFLRIETAFTNLLTFCFLMNDSIIYRRAPISYRGSRDLLAELPYESLEMAIEMAGTWQDLNAAVAFFARFSDRGDMRLFETETIWFDLDGLDHRSFFVVYEINIQFLLLYLLSKLGEGLADNVLKVPGAQDILTKFNSPSIKVRYFMRPSLTGDNLKQDIAPRRKVERVVSRAAFLSSIDIKRLFGVDLMKNQCRESSESSEVRTQADVIAQFVNGLETEEVDVEDMMLTLASENLGLGTYEKEGMIPSLEYLRDSEKDNAVEWRLFPLSMRRLETAAVGKETMKAQK